MRAPRARRGWLLLLSAIAPLICVSAHATVPVTDYLVIQPIDVCGTSGPNSTTGCAPFNNLTKSPDPSKATSTTPIGFVDTTTNINISRAIWLQSGIDVTFLPFVTSTGLVAEYNNSNYQSITLTCSTANQIPCTSSITSTGTFGFKNLSSGTATGASGCTSHCNVPLASTLYASPNTPNAINMFFVNSLIPGAGVASPIYGFAWLNGNGIAVAANTFFPTTLGATPRFDTLAHEIGHNLGLDHSTFGGGTLCTGVPSPQGCNAMDGGSMRIVPASSGCSTPTINTTSNTFTNTGGALYDLDSGGCTARPATPIADNLLLGNSTNVQQGQALLSGFMNPVPNVNATAGGGDISLTVSYPKIQQAGGREGEYIFALVLALPQGFSVGSPPSPCPSGVTCNGPTTYPTGQTPQVFGTPQVLNGNNGNGNTNCLKPITGAPSIQCLEIDFVADTFTANNLSPSLTLTGFTQTACTLTGSSTVCPTPTVGGKISSKGDEAD